MLFAVFTEVGGAATSKRRDGNARQVDVLVVRLVACAADIDNPHWAYAADKRPRVDAAETRRELRATKEPRMAVATT